MAHDGLQNRQPLKGPGEIDRLALVVEHCSACRSLCRMAQHLLSKIHQPLIIRVGRIELHHRKFRVVPRAEALVTEITINLIDPLKATHNQSL